MFIFLLITRITRQTNCPIYYSLLIIYGTFLFQRVSGQLD